MATPAERAGIVQQLMSMLAGGEEINEAALSLFGQLGREDIAQMKLASSGDQLIQKGINALELATARMGGAERIQSGKIEGALRVGEQKNAARMALEELRLLHKDDALTQRLIGNLDLAKTKGQQQVAIAELKGRLSNDLQSTKLLAQMEMLSEKGGQSIRLVRARSEEIRKSSAAETENRIKIMDAEREPVKAAIRQVQSIKEPSILKVVAEALGQSKDPEVQATGLAAAQRAQNSLEEKRIRIVEANTKQFAREAKAAGIPDSVIAEFAGQIPQKVNAARPIPILSGERMQMLEQAKARAATVATEAAKTGIKGRSLLGTVAAIGIPALLGGLIGRASGGGGEQKMNPQLLMQLMQQQSAAGGGQTEMNTSKTLVDMARMVSMLKNLQQLGGLTAQPASVPLV